mmetsp:Transcript_78161/g.210376  ORF Transcript_78161/g.210376 Transcript_78161/m.210376 type:complete len:511 (+) Transcript_78161:357-1889(+)
MKRTPKRVGRKLKRPSMKPPLPRISGILMKKKDTPSTKPRPSTQVEEQTKEEDGAEEEEKEADTELAGFRSRGSREQRSFVKKDKGEKGAAASPAGASPSSVDKKKASRNWDPLVASSKGPVDSSLDRSRDKPGAASVVDEDDRRAYLGTGVADVDNWEVESEDEDEEGGAAAAASSKGKASSAAGGKSPAAAAAVAKKPSSRGIFSYLQGLTGTRALEAADLDPVIAKFREMLVAKNVAVEIADKLCSSVSTSLMGKKIGGFNGVKNAVKEALEDGLTRILTPKQSMDILAQVRSVQAKGRPYVIVFVGVNGVGKSTSLSKVCFWLKSQGLKVLLAACDTFRSGAVEQLKTHAARLDVPVYEKGYNKDAASIAMDSVKYAAQNKFDVVLVDTAGRMQDNEPLMRSLSKLVNLNTPDLVLFVGEALVGNDSIDQVTKFNQALKETAYGNGQPRLIDGIMLTKFDTIDDKVGAAVSMVYVTGQPVIFVGVGQTYTDLKKLNVRNIVKLLLR